MKSKNLFINFALLLMTLPGWAASTPYPLNQPGALALDSKGNLYVANTVTSQILVYSPGYVQQTKKTISHNVLYPLGVALDPVGDVWVVNSGFNENPGSVTVYLPSGAQDTSRTITNSNFYPGAITSDGVGNMWITAGNSEIDVYPVYGLNPPAPIKTFTVPSVVTGIAAHNMWIAYTGSANTTLQEIGPWLTGAFSVYTTQPTIAYCAAYDAAGNLYTGSSSSPYALNVTSASTNTTTQLAGLSNFPFGIAVDSARGRIYVSDPFDNLINVFDLKGNLIKVIQ